MRRFRIETWGCQMNVHDSEKMAGLLAPLGYTPAERAADADLILLNTCSVREKAAGKLFTRLGQLRSLKRRNPDLVIGVCGCVAQVEGEAIFRRAPHVDLVMGPRNLGQIGTLLERARRDGRSISLARDDDPIEFASDTTARAAGPHAYVTVMEGCNKSCSYCIVPFTRGREAYRDPDAVVAEVRALAERGTCEIELLGQNVNAWHHGGDDFAALLHRVDRVPGIRRLRFTTSHPGHLKRRIMDAMRDLPSVCDHLHLPVQSGADRVLRAMNRGYTVARYLAVIDGLRERIPGITFTTDLIVGFPGESEAEFRATLDLLARVEFDQVYAFAYSPRPGTAALGLPGEIPGGVKRDRLQEVLRVQESIQARRNAALVGRSFEVLFDGPSRLDPSVLRGRTTCNRIVHVPAADVGGRRLAAVRITRAHAHSLSGAVAPPPARVA